MKNAVVSGSSSGLGLELSKILLEKGYRVFGISRRNKNNELFIYPNYSHISCDLSKISHSNQILKFVDKKLDIFINNAGIYIKKEFIDTKLAEISKLVDLNIKGTFHLTNILLPLMNNPSSIVFINSVAGINHISDESIYCATKHALASFANILGKELFNQGIKVSSFYPGGINTSIQEHNPKKELLLDPHKLAIKIINMLEDPDIYIKSGVLLPNCEYF